MNEPDDYTYTIPQTPAQKAVTKHLKKVTIRPSLDGDDDKVTVSMVWDDIDAYEKYLAMLVGDDDIIVTFPDWDADFAQRWTEKYPEEEKEPQTGGVIHQTGLMHIDTTHYYRCPKCIRHVRSAKHNKGLHQVECMECDWKGNYSECTVV